MAQPRYGQVSRDADNDDGENAGATEPSDVAHGVLQPRRTGGEGGISGSAKKLQNAFIEGLGVPLDDLAGEQTEAKDEDGDQDDADKHPFLDVTGGSEQGAERGHARVGSGTVGPQYQRDHRGVSPGSVRAICPVGFGSVSQSR